MKLKQEISIVKDFLEPYLYSQNVFQYETIIIKTILDNIKAQIDNYVKADSLTETNGLNAKKNKIKKKPTLQEISKMAKACNKKPLPKKCLLRRAKKSTTY